MAQIEIFEPGLCCGTGICGVDVDQALVTVSADLDWLRSQDTAIARYNLAQEPLAFVSNETVRAFVHTVGQEGLPLTLVDGLTVLTGRYPSRVELAKWAGLAVATPQQDASPRLLMMATATGADADGASCTVGGGCC
jgi:arsenite-transporting ATPase